MSSLGDAHENHIGPMSIPKFLGRPGQGTHGAGRDGNAEKTIRVIYESLQSMTS